MCIHLQGTKLASAHGVQQPSGSNKSSSAEAAGTEELHDSTAGDGVTDLVSDDEAAEVTGQDAPGEAAQQASLSTLERQAPGPEDIAMADGEPAAIQCVHPACRMLHWPIKLYATRNIQHWSSVFAEHIRAGLQYAVPSSDHVSAARHAGTSLPVAHAESHHWRVLRDACPAT